MNQKITRITIVASDKNDKRAAKIARIKTLHAKRIKRVTLLTVMMPFLGFIASVIMLWNWGINLAILTIFVLMFCLSTLGIGVGFHRLWTHRAFKTSTRMGYALAILGSIAAQGPIFFWVAIHRRHHHHSDHPGDPHSPHFYEEPFKAVFKGFLHAHIGWMFKSELDDWGKYIPHLLKDPVLFRINRYYLVWVFLGLLFPAILGALLMGTLKGAFLGFLWGGLVRIFICHHVAWSVNSICHLFGSRPFKTSDESRNNPWLALLSFGEAWHNNHHAFPAVAVHGFHWWQLDINGMAIRLLAFLGLAWDIKYPKTSLIQKKKI